MVTTPALGVFIYRPTDAFAGVYYMEGYSASQMRLDSTSIRHGTSTTFLLSEPSRSVMTFNYTSNNGVPSDPKIDFVSGNLIMWAHGGKDQNSIKIQDA